MKLWHDTRKIGYDKVYNDFVAKYKINPSHISQSSWENVKQKGCHPRFIRKCSFSGGFTLGDVLCAEEECEYLTSLLPDSVLAECAIRFFGRKTVWTTKDTVVGPLQSINLVMTAHFDNLTEHDLAIQLASCILDRIIQEFSINGLRYAASSKRKTLVKPDFKSFADNFILLSDYVPVKQTEKIDVAKMFEVCNTVVKNFIPIAKTAIRQVQDLQRNVRADTNLYSELVYGYNAILPSELSAQIDVLVETTWTRLKIIAESI